MSDIVTGPVIVGPTSKPRSGPMSFVGPPQKTRSGPVSFLPTDRPGPGTGTGGEIGFWVSQDQEMTDSDEENAYHNGSGDDGSPERLCDDTPEVVDRYVSAELFCVYQTGTKKTQSGHDLKTPKE